MTEEASIASEQSAELQKQARELLGKIDRDLAGMSGEEMQSLLDALHGTKSEQVDAEKRFRLVTETIQDVFWMCTPGIGEQFYVSPGYETIWGRSLVELRERPLSFLESVHPEDRENFTKILDERHAQGKSYRCEYRIIRPDGSLRWILERGFPIRDDRGEVELMTGVCTDVTEHKHLEVALRESETRLRATIESLPFDFFVIGKDGRYIMQNSACRERWGDVIGRRPKDVATDEESLELWQSNNRRAFAGKRVDADVVFRHQGKEIHCRNIISPVRDGDDVTSIVAVNIDITASKQAADLLRESEQRAGESLAELELVYRTAPVGLCLLDTELRYIRINDELAAMNGRPVSEHIGRRVREVVPEIAEAFELPCRKVFETGEPSLNLEMYGTTPAQPGRQRTWLISQHPLKDQNHAVVAVSVVVQEITERRQAEEALRASEEQYRGIFEATTDGLGIFDQEGTLVEANPAFCRMHDCTRDEMLATPSHDFVHPDSHPLFEQFIRVIPEGKLFHSEAQDVRKDGTPFDIEVDGIPFNYQGCPHLLAVLRDISERKRADEALRASEEQYRGIFEATSDGLVIFDQDGTLVEANPAFCRIHGYTREEMLETPPIRFVHLDSHPVFQEFLETSKKGEAFHSEAQGLRKDGTPFDVDVTGVPFNYQGHPHFLGILRDIAARKLAEQEKQFARQILLEHQQLQRERAEAELAKLRDELVQSTEFATAGKMSAQIAHDIRNPLAAILNTAGFLKRTIPPKQTKWHEGLDLIEEEVLICNRILSNLLELTRSREPMREMIDLGELLCETAERLAWPSSVRLHFSSDPEPFPLEADRVQFRQVLGNLLTNSLDALGQSGTITVHAQRSADVDTVTVADDGPGILPEHRESLFDLFFTTKATGTGLGLGICRRIIERHGGSISLADDTPPGAAFRIQLPRAGE